MYDNDGRPVGRVSGLTDDGFEVEAVNPDESEVEELPGQEFGEGYLMWQCAECGEMGELNDSNTVPVVGDINEAAPALHVWDT